MQLLKTSTLALASGWGVLPYPHVIISLVCQGTDTLRFIQDIKELTVLYTSGGRNLKDNIDIVNVYALGNVGIANVCLFEFVAAEGHTILIKTFKQALI